jgi:hypothetical protein
MPFTVYAANVVWSMVHAVAAGMWPTAIAGVVLALLPAATALLPSHRAPRIARA